MGGMTRGALAAIVCGGVLLYVLSRRGELLAVEDAGADVVDVELPGEGGAERAGRVVDTVRGWFKAAPLDPALALQLALERVDGSGAPDVALVMAIIEQESGFDPDAVGTSGEIGLMQILPTTGGQFGFTDANALFDPATNISAGIAYLRWLYAYAARRGEVNLDEVIGAYNAGAGNVWQRGFVPWSYVRSVKRRLERWEGALVS